MTSSATADLSRQGDVFDPATITWVLDDAAVEWLIEAISTATEVIMDEENTGLDEYATEGGLTNGGVGARVALVSLTLPQPDDEGDPTTWVVPLSHPESPFRNRWQRVFTGICRTIAGRNKPLSNHNVKYDTRWSTKHTGVDLSGQIEWCTRAAAHMQDENSLTALKDRVPVVFGVDRWDEHDLSVPGAAERVPLFELGVYAARDTYWTWRLKHWQQHAMFLTDDAEPVGPDEVEDARLGRLATWCVMPTIRTLTAVEQRGIGIDLAWATAKTTELGSEVEPLFDELVGRYPQLDPEHASFAPTSNWFRAWSEAAVEAGDLIVGELTPTGKPRWSKGVLKRQARTGSEVAAKLLEYRARTKQLEFLSSWFQLEHDGRIYTTYNAGSVVTGRLSSSTPNMQQVTSALRPAFVPTQGYVLADLDYSQIEMRVAAFVSRCEPMLQAFRDGLDTHKLLALQMMQRQENARAVIAGHDPRILTLDDVTPEARQAAKAGNFGLLFGMSAGGFRYYADDAYDVVLTEQEAVDTRNAFFDLWTGLAAWHERQSMLAQRYGKVTSPIGRVRRVGGFGPTDDGAAERMAINSPVQGFASDIMQIAAASIEGMIEGHERVRGARIVGTVHDSILVEVPSRGWEDYVGQCQERMRTGVLPVLEKMGCTFDVPLESEAKVGTRWGLTDVGEM